MISIKKQFLYVNVKAWLDKIISFLTFISFVGGIKMNSQTKIVKIKCPQCLNFMLAKVDSKNNLIGKCTVCKSLIISKQKNKREKNIKILRDRSM